MKDLLNKNESKSAANETDWQKEKNEWLGFIQSFYSSVESWLKPYKDAGKLTLNYQKIMLTEENIGTYDVNVMVVNFAGKKLKLEPIGTLLIGTKGRIDMEGARGSVQFILADKDKKGMNVRVSVSINEAPPKKEEQPKVPDWTWKIVRRESHKISFKEFNEENFFDALMEVVNG